MYQQEGIFFSHTDLLVNKMFEDFVFLHGSTQPNNRCSAFKTKKSSWTIWSLPSDKILLLKDWHRYLEGDSTWVLLQQAALEPCAKPSLKLARRTAELKMGKSEWWGREWHELNLATKLQAIKHYQWRTRTNGNGRFQRGLWDSIRYFSHYFCMQFVMMPLYLYKGRERLKIISIYIEKVCISSVAKYHRKEHSNVGVIDCRHNHISWHS